ncbi:MAG: hypothetical protein ACTSPT_05615 [Candidatus Heimdallarchaeota archaeon]
MSMKFYQVLEDGTLDEENSFQSESMKVIILVDDQFKRIFLWKGANSGIKKKFIGSRAAAELRKTYYGFAYRLSVVEAGDETQEFEFTVKRSRGEAEVGVIDSTTRGIPTNPTEMGLESDVDIKLRGNKPTKKIIYTDKDKASMGQFAGARKDTKIIQPKPKDGPRPKRPQPAPAAPQGGQQKASPKPQRTILSEMMSGGEEPKIIQPASTKSESRPKPAAAAMPTPPPTPPQPRAGVEQTKVDPQEAFHMIEELGVPAGYERDLIIVGTSVYKQHGKEFLVPPDPPEGVFLAPDRVPRIIIENGVVKVIEVLKKIDKAVKPKDDVQFDQGIEDLMSTFQIEVE